MKALSEMRSKQTIFDDLAKLCSLPGYVHAIAYLCFRDNMEQKKVQEPLITPYPIRRKDTLIG